MSNLGLKVTSNVGASRPTRDAGQGVFSSSLTWMLLLMVLLGVGAEVRGERAAIRKYTTADGLPSNTLLCVRRDSRGFLWFCTTEGLARFDGYTFANYGIEQGLPDSSISDVLEARDGTLWIGTRRGVASFNPKASSNRKLFMKVDVGTSEAARLINGLQEDLGGNLWVATDEGLFEGIGKQTDRTFTRTSFKGARSQNADILVVDHQGVLWAVVGGYGTTQLCWRTPTGETGCQGDPFLTRNRVLSLFVDNKNQFWMGTYEGLAMFVSNPRGKNDFVARVFQKKDGLPNNISESIYQTRDGRLWVSAGGLVEIVRSGNNVRFQVKGLAKDGFSGIEAEDVEGNFWMNATRLARNGFVTYGVEDGLDSDGIKAIFEGSDGELYMVTGVHNRVLNRFDGKRFHAVAPNVPGHESTWDWGGWGWGQIHLQDHLGEWWIATGTGVLRYPAVKHFEDLRKTKPIAEYGNEVGPGGLSTFRMYEDRRGDIWFSGWAGNSLARWERASGKTHFLRKRDGWRWPEVTAFREDPAGDLWFGLWGHDLVRYRQGKFESFEKKDGVPDGTCFAIFLDHAGRLWAGTTKGGLVRSDDPSTERPHFRVYDTSSGISSNDVRAITEDKWGEIYFWTGKGVDRLDPETGGIVQFTQDDGLVPVRSDHQVAYADRHGNLWFGLTGLSKLEPVEKPHADGKLPISLQRVRVRGVPLGISEMGESHLAGVVLPPDQNNLLIEFGSQRFGVGEVLRYQYRLKGADKDWSPPTELRVVNYAELKPARYIFEVRTINDRGETSVDPATFEFRVLAPVWQRWWFLSLVLLLLSLTGYAIYRYRLNQLLELERVRTRIASDLHDEVGSGLTQIAILSEVARQQESSPTSSSQMEKIADLSRELVGDMSEIVWSLNPEHNQVVDLVQRMRRFASDVFVARGIEFAFQAPVESLDSRLRSDVRRQIYLIFKEAVNNCVRHSQCARVELSLKVEKGELYLRVADNGCAIGAGKPGANGIGGHGLKNMRERAAAMGGTLEITSNDAQGTLVCLRVPTGRSRLAKVLKPT
jgi:signal transduction histidine kinase/ligand-binding sensor domain-containing protein